MENIKEEAIIFDINSSFKMSWSLMGGMDNLLIKYFKNQEFYLPLTERTTSFIKMIIKKTVELVVDAILPNNNLASQQTL